MKSHLCSWIPMPEAQDFRGREAELLEATVDRLVEGRVVGWFQGRMEFGPRALGARSILADPRRPEMRDLINARVKQRESLSSFRACGAGRSRCRALRSRSRLAVHARDLSCHLAVGTARDNPCGRIGAAADRGRREQSPLRLVVARVSRKNRLPDPVEHVVQHARTTDCLHTR